MSRWAISRESNWNRNVINCWHFGCSNFFWNFVYGHSKPVGLTLFYLVLNTLLLLVSSIYLGTLNDPNDHEKRHWDLCHFTRLQEIILDLLRATVSSAAIFLTFSWVGAKFLIPLFGDLEPYNRENTGDWVFSLFLSLLL